MRVDCDNTKTIGPLVQGQRFWWWSSTSCGVLPIHSGAFAFRHPWTNCTPKPPKQDAARQWLMVSHGTRSLVPFCTYRIQTLQDLAYLSMRWCISVCHNIDLLDSEKAQRGGFVCSSLQTIHHSSIFVHDGVLVSQLIVWRYDTTWFNSFTLYLFMFYSNIYIYNSVFVVFCSTDAGLCFVFLYITYD